MVENDEFLLAVAAFHRKRRCSVTNDEETLTKSDSMDSATGLVSAADDETARKYLIQILENDEKLLVRFKNLSVPEISIEDMMKYKDQIDRVLMKYQDRHHFIY